MRPGITLSMVFLIILSFYNCARQMSKKTLTDEELLDQIPRWPEKFKKKSGTGEIIISGPEYRFSSYFSLNYEVNTNVLSGQLLGSFGMVVGRFYFSPDSVSAVDRHGKEMKEQVLSILGNILCKVLPRYIVWDIPLLSNWRVIPLESGWSLLGSNIEVSISPEFLPSRVLIYGEDDSSIKYSDYKTVEGVKQPFRIIAKRGKNSLEIEHYTMRLK